MTEVREFIVAFRTENDGLLPSLRTITETLGVTQWRADTDRKRFLQDIGGSCSSIRSDGQVQEIGIKRFGATRPRKKTPRVFVRRPCVGCNKQIQVSEGSENPMCGTCRSQNHGAMTPIQKDCVARGAQCEECYHVLILESLKPGQCRVKNTKEVVEALSRG